MPTEHNAFMSYLTKANKLLENITWREFNHYDFFLEFKILYIDQREDSMMRVHTALAEELNLVPNTHVMLFTTAYETASSGIWYLWPPEVSSFINMHTHTSHT